MEFLPSSKLCHADELSRLIPQNSKPLEDTVIVLYIDLRPGPEIALASLADNMGQG